LLVAEHLAMGVVREHGKFASKSELVESTTQMFLEVERFDRTPSGGRSGVLSSMALDAEFVGRMLSWTDSVTRLAEQGALPAALVTDVAWLRSFFVRLRPLPPWPGIGTRQAEPRSNSGSD